MGCDIHLHIEYAFKADIAKHEAQKKAATNDASINVKEVLWITFGTIGLTRRYSMFGYLCQGVRMDFPNGFPAKGLPEDMGSGCEIHVSSYITKDGKGIGECTLAEAEAWVKDYNGIIINDSQGLPFKIHNPYYHSHSWLTTDELETAIRLFEADGGKEIDYNAVLAAMKALETEFTVARIVFWFDN